MKLTFSPASPFARKVRIAAIELGLIDKIELTPVTLAPGQPNAEYSKISPLKKLPVLILDNGDVILDSYVIVEYLDEVFPDTPFTPSPYVPSESRPTERTPQRPLEPWTAMAPTGSSILSFRSTKKTTSTTRMPAASSRGCSTAASGETPRTSPRR